MISEIQSDVEKIEADTSIYEYADFNARTNAIDFIDFHIIDRIDGLIQKAGQNDELTKLKIYANGLKAKLENINTEMFLDLEKQINISKNKGFVFRGIIANFLNNFQHNEEEHDAIGYDNLDILINGLLSTNTIDKPIKKLEPEMVFYQKTPARVVVELSKKIDENDIFFDIGSGIGQVVILVNLISSARVIGIEFEPSFCNYAKVQVSKLNLDNIEIINDDARMADYSSGTVFFLYTPFVGKIMQDLLALLKKISLQKVIRIFTYGPCSLTISQQNWLKCINGNADNINKLYEFKSFSTKDFHIQGLQLGQK
ncbi:putative RNA methylase [Pedobacter sp. UYP30]|uniref:class I SAM-dependent methyltransferase n=1 Tax=Pedobacter sp. UYP30 TaxID=1756400 RepID=UPI0033934A84